ncbi:hypothetical protein NQZ68_039778, partial [Dissostichus eleginoides]
SRQDHWRTPHGSSQTSPLFPSCAAIAMETLASGFATRHPADSRKHPPKVNWCYRSHPTCCYDMIRRYCLHFGGRILNDEFLFARQ